ncbi:PucR family transcriptional regulator [Streptomyces sp. NPDC047017]|uniref:PucR family transcriptional regulator n=1 Tax=Streptomyces sp. NPDC047017 TaxID=3155024 RepID=UPI0033DB5F86
MLVKQVMELADLGLTPLWAPPHALRRAVTGVTTADMANPSTYLSPGEIVLTGLVWWQPDRCGTARAFVSAVRAAGAVALIAGEGVHGGIPDELVEACRDHELPLFSVPRSTTFRTVLDSIYVRLWADVRASDAPALPSMVRDELLGSIASAAPLDDALRLAVERLGLSELTLTSLAGRVIASTHPHAASARPGARGARVPVGTDQGSPFDGWWLCTTPAVAARQRPVLDEVAALLSTRLAQHRKRLTVRGARAGALLAALEAKDTAATAGIVQDCGLPGDTTLTPVVVRTPGASAAWAVDAANELLAACAVEFAVCPGGTDESVGFVAAPPDRFAQRLTEHLPDVQGLIDADLALAVGVGPEALPRDLAPALRGARYLADASGQRPDPVPRVCTTSAVTSLGAVLGGLPPTVSHAFQANTIGPVISYDAEKGTELLQTLATFLDNGSSWTRTAAALHLHVNTVHYRIERAEALTGRRVSDPRGQIDLHAALILHQWSTERSGRTEEGG